MRFTYDSVNGYAVSCDQGSMVGYFDTFAEAVAVAQDGDHIHMICGRGNNIDHKPGCKHAGCDGTISPFPEGACSVCKD